jgi:hypothetical protein
MVSDVVNAVVDFLIGWTGFALLMAVVVFAAVLLWRRWRRWNPTIGTSPEAREAEARLMSTRLGEQR